MVSTRHSMGADEQLVSLETMPGTFSSSPSPKKRRLSIEDTPEQTFVDARATPFSKRERRISDSSPVRVNKSTKTSHTTKDTKPGKSVTVAAQNIDSDEDDSSDDEAPEAISNANTAKTAKLSEAARQKALQEQALEAREKRRIRDAKLRVQKEATKRESKLNDDKRDVTEPAEHEDSASEDCEEDVNDEATDEEIDATKVTAVKRQPLPRLLPDEILNAPQAPTTLDHASLATSEPVKHTRFEPKKEITTLKQGALTVQLLKRQRKDLAPRQTASVANTKNQWLYQRGQHSSNRRPIKKPLA